MTIPTKFCALGAIDLIPRPEREHFILGSHDNTERAAMTLLRADKPNCRSKASG